MEGKKYTNRISFISTNYDFDPLMSKSLFIIITNKSLFLGSVIGPQFTYEFILLDAMVSLKEDLQHLQEFLIFDSDLDVGNVETFDEELKSVMDKEAERENDENYRVDLPSRVTTGKAESPGL